VLARLGVSPEELAAGGGPPERLRELLAGSDGSVVAAALGEYATAPGAALLAAAEASATDRAVRKAIRRALYRLGQRGVPLPDRQPPRAPRAKVSDVEGLLSHVDGRGDRLVWLLRPLAPGGTLLVAAHVSESDGLRDLDVAEVSRKQVRAARQQLAEQNGIRLIAADWRLLDALIVEAEATARASGRTAPSYQAVRARLTSDPPAAPREPVSPRVRPPAADDVERLVARSAELLEQPEFRSWWPPPDAAQPFVGEIASLRNSPLVLSEAQQTERLRHVLEQAAAAFYPPERVARRLDAMAYVLAETGRAEAAQQALAVATAVRQRPRDAASVPLIRTLTQRGLGLLLAAEQSRAEEERRGSLVLTPAEAALRARSASRPPHTRA
jgi:hypothetical protein